MLTYNNTVRQVGLFYQINGANNCGFPKWDENKDYTLRP